MSQVRLEIANGTQFGPYTIIEQLPFGKENNFVRKVIVECTSGKRHKLCLSSITKRKYQNLTCPGCQQSLIAVESCCRAVAHVNTERERERLRNERAKGVKANDQVAAQQI